jgi:hypothetical protein
MLYLGIFVILSAAFDFRFYPNSPIPAAHRDEMIHAVQNFHSLVHVFSARFIILLGGEPIAISYVVDRLLAEFAAAAVNLAKAIRGPEIGDGDDTLSKTLFTAAVEDILHASHPDAFPYYSRCLDRGHKDFLWTGPQVEILPRSDDIVSIIPFTTMGELLDSPSYSIYVTDLDNDAEPPAPPTPPIPSKPTEKAVYRRIRPDDGMDDEEPSKKRRR